MTSTSLKTFEALPVDADAYQRTLKALGAAANAGTGFPFLKMAKDGKWSYGVEAIEVTENQNWRVNPHTIRMGVIGWANGQKVGEEMHLLGQGAVDKSALPPIQSNKQGDGWKDQLSIDLVSVEQPGLQVTFSTTSDGGTKAIAALAAAIGQRGNQNEHPIVRCVTDSYVHPAYGKTYKPQFAIVRWDSNDATEKKRKLV